MAATGGAIGRWAGLVVLSAVVGVALEVLRLPAAFLLGPLVAGIVFRLIDRAPRVPRAAYLAAQVVVGTMIGSALTPAIVDTFRHEWPILLGTVAAMVAVASLLGWVMSRAGVVPGTTGVWGSSPGAASAMVILAEAHGADARLVAFMQYLRVLFVASTASIVARLWIGGGAMPGLASPFPPLDLRGFGISVAVMVVAGGIGRLTRMPSGTMLVPLVTAAALNGSGTMSFTLPPWLLILAYAGLGWTIGLGFTRAALAHAWHALPAIVASILVLMLFAAGLAVVLVETLGVDPLTAYLATSPGGMDTVAIIAASTPVDVSFVMALQAVRFFVLILIGPALSRAVARRLPSARA